MNSLWIWIKTHPQRTAGIVQAASGSILTSLPTLGLSARALGLMIAGFGVVQAVFGYLKSQQDEPPQT